MKTKRRLPILQGASEQGSEEARPRAWHWVGFGVVIIFVAWLPLSALGAWIALRVGGSAAIVAQVAALALASMAGGWVVGRWGSASAGVRQAAGSGLAAALVATALAWTRGGVPVGALVTIAVAAPFAALGGWLGLRRRARG